MAIPRIYGLWDESPMLSTMNLVYAILGPTVGISFTHWDGVVRSLTKGPKNETKMPYDVGNDGSGPN
jgi:hypothetical protein